MADFVLSCCSTADLTEQHFLSRDIRYICFHLELDGIQYSDDLGQSVPFDLFYQKIANGSVTKTSQVNAEEFENYFEEILKAGKDILHVCLSSGLSGVINSAMIAKASMEKKYPERKIEIVDSLGASSGYGLIMDKLADLRDEGLSIDAVKNWVEAHKLNCHHWFFSTDLSYYIKGGRISKTAGFFGNMLNICPLLNMDCNGKLIPRQKIRTKKRVMKTIVNEMINHADQGSGYNGKCFISHSACLNDARMVADMIEKNFPHLDGKPEIFSVGTVIGSHTGPGTVAIFFWGDERIE